MGIVKDKPEDLDQYSPKEHGSCGLVARFRKDTLGGQGGTYGVLRRTLDSMSCLQQRGGSIQTDRGTDGDGAGVMTGIPPQIVAEDLERAGLNRSLAPVTGLGVFFLMPGGPGNRIQKIEEVLRDKGLDVLYNRLVPTQPKALGPQASERQPRVVRFGILFRDDQQMEKELLAARVQIEQEIQDTHVVSLSRDSLVYKVMGTGKTLKRFYPELQNSGFKTRFAIGHIRMSTNTQPDFRLAHPYSLLVHNGEINTIDQLIRRARAMGIPLPKHPSDSMVVDRVMHWLIAHAGCSLATAYRMVVPLVDNEIERLPDRERRLHSRLKMPFGNLGQGPAGIIARHENEALIASDAMSLRPLWFGETEKEFYVTSERGSINFLKNEMSPRPLAGGETVILDLEEQEVWDRERLNDRLERDVRRLFQGDHRGDEQSLTESSHEFSVDDPEPDYEPVPSRAENRALGLNKDDLQVIRHMADTGEEPLGSVGYHPGPIAPAADPEEKLIADYCLENVAVITNPALDADRESRYFSLRVRFGDRGNFGRVQQAPCWELPSPLVSTDQKEHLLDEFREHDTTVCEISLVRKSDESLKQACRRIEGEAGKGEGFQIIHAHDQESGGLLDPALGVAALVRGLRRAGRREDSRILLESRRLRNLHDVMIVYGLGAELVCPVLIQQHAMDLSRAKNEDGKRIQTDELDENEKKNLRFRRLRNTFKALKKGMKKVISTMGIHEIEGYGRIFSAIGLSDSLLEYLEIDGYLAGEKGGLDWERLEAVERDREEKREQDEGYPGRSTKPWTAKIRNVINEIADGDRPYTDYEQAQEEYNRETPTAIRHCLELPEQVESPVEPQQVSLERDGLSAPLVFSAMSYGSQNLISHTSYAEAARRLDFLSLNGEGGEPPHLRSRPFASRGQQIASARFGIDTDLIANSQFVQIKVGQGAKPGEGGMLRGVKVNPHIARTRSTPAFTDLISPANNHDFYSIEDLIPTLINELKAVNPEIKVDVKVPAIPNLARIITGLAKEGHPDSISISGYEGSTGAARRHSIKRVGFPVELAIDEAHRALCEAGLRDRVFLQADGGMKTVEDVMKMGVLGADRVGFGTLCMAAIGCIYCMQCYTNECPTGITSPFNSLPEASKNDVKPFEPRVLETATEHLVRFFTGMKDCLSERLASLGLTRFEDLHGRHDLLRPRIDKERLDLSPLLSKIDFFDQEPHDGEIVRDRQQTSITHDQSEMFREEWDRAQQQENSEPRRIHFCTVLDNTDRAVGTGVSGTWARLRRNNPEKQDRLERVRIEPENSCIPGNGLGAFNEEGVVVRIRGGAQDGTAKSMSGGRIVVLPGENGMGKSLDGSIGKSAAYGATGGTLVVTGPWADSRFGVRCSGADLIHLGKIQQPLTDSKALINSRANLKGFAFEYMTSGRGLILGDPGMDFCSGMTGGVVFVMLQPKLGLTRQALRQRISPGVLLEELDEPTDYEDLRDLINTAWQSIHEDCPQRAQELKTLEQDPTSFVKVVPDVDKPRDLEFIEDPTEIINDAYERYRDLPEDLPTRSRQSIVES